MSELVIPHGEDQEMGKVKEIFDRALNALVNATSLAQTVEQLKTDLDSLRVQVQTYRNTIANQDDQITRLRQDRDVARTAQYQAEDSSRHTANELSVVKRENDSLNSANVRLNDRITEVLKERDDAQYKLLELTEAHAALSKKMEAIKGHFEAMFGFAEAPKPVEQVTPPIQHDTPEPTPEPTWTAPMTEQPQTEHVKSEEAKPEEHEAWWTKEPTPQQA
jgi:predicted  nucleic acid-binding Zn-ribbon protein